jgi:hypothetical protein
MGIFLCPAGAAALSSEPPDSVPPPEPADTQSSGAAAVPAADNPAEPDAAGEGAGGSGNNAGAEIPDLFGADNESAATTEGAFTSPGSGTVVDNATDADGKEFYTIEAADGSVFYLIIDRQRGTKNVYFLNAVTKDDLIPLAEEGEAGPLGIIQPEPEEDPAAPKAEDEDAQEDAEEPAKKEGTPYGTYIFIVLAITAAAGTGYYLKIYRPRQEASGMESDGYGDEAEYDTDYSYEEETYPDEYVDALFGEYGEENMDDSIADEENGDAP